MMIGPKHLIAIASFTVLMVACRPGDRPREHAATATPASDSTAGIGRQLSISGCLEAGAVGATTYVLRNIHVQPDNTSDPHRNLTTSQPNGITEGSWVTLRGNPDLGAHIGRRITVMGAVVDSGANTIGTAGAAGTLLPSGDRSQAGSSEHHSTKVKKEEGRIGRESMANGTAADLRVVQVQDIGEPCRDTGIRR
jgi:hypothetical protein